MCWLRVNFTIPGLADFGNSSFGRLREFVKLRYGYRGSDWMSLRRKFRNWSKLLNMQENSIVNLFILIFVFLFCKGDSGLRR